MNSSLTNTVLEMPSAADERDYVLEGGDIVPGQGTNPKKLVGVEALMMAVFEDALRCYFGEVPSLRTEAEDWIRSNRKDSPFTFCVACETFGIHVSAARKSLSRMRQRSRGIPAAVEALLSERRRDVHRQEPTYRKKRKRKKAKRKAQTSVHREVRDVNSR